MSCPLLATGKAVRAACRSQTLVGPTSSLAPGFAQANLVILPREDAFDFLLFCQRNPKPCPVLEVLEPGQRVFGDDIDIATDLPRYRVFVDGVLQQELTDISDLWREDFVTFVIGCSFSFESALISAGLEIRHITMNRNVPMYNTSIECRSAGKFSANMVVSMRPFKPSDALIAAQITARYPKVHGPPVHIGDPQGIGIMDINSPDYGDAVEINIGEIPVFWACGVTPQNAVMKSKPKICITHAPGHMLVLDSKNEELSLC